MVTVVGGSIVGLCYGWKLSLVGIACIPLVISAGYIRLRVVVMKDQINRRTHANSAQLACEAAGAIKTVASLTREDDCLKVYSKSLEKPLRVSNLSAFNSTLWFSLSQSMVFFVIALVRVSFIWIRIRLKPLLLGVLVRFAVSCKPGIQHPSILHLFDGVCFSTIRLPF